MSTPLSLSTGLALTFALGLSPGTAAQIQPELITVANGQTTSDGIQGVVAAGGRLYYAEGPHGGPQALVTTSATGASNLTTLATGEDVDPPIPFGERVVFRINSSSPPASDVYITDGTAAGTELLLHLDADDGWGFSGITLGDRFLFAADDGVLGRELWCTDGTASGTALLADIHPSGSGVQSEVPGDLFLFDGRAWFQGMDEDHGAELWSTDGTALGTTMFADLHTGPGNSWFNFPPAFLGDAFYVAEGSHLWWSDGVDILDVDPVLDSVRQAVTYAGEVYFTGFSGLLGTHGLHAVGGPSGFRTVEEWPAGVEDLQVTASGLFFHFSGESWTSDGTNHGTVSLQAALGLGPGDDAEPLGEFDGRCLLETWLPGTTMQGLWISDGTAAGTSPVGGGATLAGDLTNIWFTDMGTFVAVRDTSVSPLETTLQAVGPFTRYGRGSAGSGGHEPRLVMDGDATAGGTIEITIEDGAGGALAAVFLGLVPQELPFGLGGSATLQVDLIEVLPLTILPGSGPGTGETTLALTLPADMPEVALIMQLAVEDGDAPSLVGFSTGDAVQMAITN